MNFELNLPYDPLSTTHDYLRMSIDRLIRYGWGGCVLTVNVTTMKKLPPPPDPLPLSDRAKAYLEQQYGLYVLSDYPKFPQFTRLNLITAEPVEVSLLSRSLPTLSYDIVSVTPLSDNVFKELCSKADIDLISLDVMKYQPKSCWKELKSAVNRDIAIELLYSNFLGTEVQQKNIISACDSICHSTKGRKQKGRVILLSCGTDDPDFIRSPSDVKSIARLLQIRKFNQITSKMPKTVISRGLSRKSNAGIIRKLREIPVEPSSNSDDDDDDFDIVIKDAPPK